MKTRAFWQWGFGLSLIAVPLAVGWLPSQGSTEDNEAVVATTMDAEDSISDGSESDVASDEAPPANDLAEAAVNTIATERTLPGQLKPSPAVLELIKLSDAGVSDTVMLAFVSNSPSEFDLHAEEIIYATDLGVPATVVTAMLQRDQELRSANDLSPADPPLLPLTPTRGQLASSAYPPAVTVVVAPPDNGDEFATEPFPQVEPPALPPPEATAEVGGPAFYDSLAPYGAWVDVGGYGQCWQPATAKLNHGWRPYFDRGRWVYSDCGWYWASDYSWGWAAFHYGRWFQHSQLGWCWTPGKVWGPSWVCWRQAGDYCGWAPLPPAAGFRAGVGLTYRGLPASPTCDFALGPTSFPFIRTSDLFTRHLTPCALPPAQAATLFAHASATTRITHQDGQVFHHGLAPAHVAAVTHHELRPVALRDLPAPGGVSHDPIRTQPGSKAMLVAEANLSSVPPANGQTGHDHLKSNPPTISNPVVVIGGADRRGVNDLHRSASAGGSNPAGSASRTFSSRADTHRTSSQEVQPDAVEGNSTTAPRRPVWPGSASHKPPEPETTAETSPTFQAARGFHRATASEGTAGAAAHGSQKQNDSEPAPHQSAAQPSRSQPAAPASSANSSFHSSGHSRP